MLSAFCEPPCCKTQPRCADALSLLPCSSIAIAVSLDGKPVKGLCPGETYDFTVNFPAPRAALVTVSQGTIPQSNVPRW
jgi:hypothetical protein